MSDTTNDDSRSLHAVPTPEPLAGLTGAPAAIYTELVGLTQPATAAELALAAGIGRSTTGKALTTLEQHGLAVRTPGGHDGPRRTPDLWRAAPTPEAGSNGTGDHEPAGTRQQPSVTNSEEPVGNSADEKGVPGAETTPKIPAAPDDGNAAPATAPATEAPHDAQPQDTEHADGDDSGEADHPHDEGGSDGSGDENKPAAEAGAGPQSVPTVAINLSGEKKRLAPGALRQMVIDHLQAYPGEAFTATKISRVIEKSSGAIANSLVTLARQGIAEQVSDRPRTYRLVTPDGNA